MKIAVVGSVNMDMTVKAERIPLKGETVFGGDIAYIPGGKGGNQAVALARLGANVEMFGCVGSDNFGKELLGNFIEQGVGVSNVRVIEDAPTGLAIITTGENDNTIVVVAGANDYVNKSYIDSILQALLECEIVLLQHEISAEAVEYLVNVCYENAMEIILNPAPIRKIGEDIIEKATYLTPNEHEASILFSEDNNLEDMLKKYPGKLIITLGSKGVMTVDENGEVINVLPKKVDVVDTTGAGDTLNAAFAFAISKGYGTKNALIFANTAAGISTEKFGAQAGMPCYDEVCDRIEANS